MRQLPIPAAGRTLQAWRRVLAALLLAAGADGPAQAEQPWPERLFNPQPRAGDLVLPMPCGGAMVFRPVETPSAGFLDDRRILIGGEDPGVAYAETPRYAYVAGGFTHPDDPARRLYYLGAYEVTALQVAALEAGEAGDGGCPEPEIRETLPAVGLTRTEAEAFAEAYTTWLHAAVPGVLPREDGLAGFLRLPSEAEWEYAARGGVAVSAELFRDRVFPMPDGMPGHVWFQGSQSAGGRLHPAGLLAPNPLGLHDMLGNAAEFVLDPFRLNRFGRLHGQSGGTLVKGGSFRTPRQAIRSALRRELPPFIDGAPNRPDDVGFRLAIGAPALTSLIRVNRIREEVAALAGTGEEGGPARDTTADILAELGRLAQSADTAEARRELERLAVSLRAVTEEGAGRTARTARSLMRLGGFLGGTLREKLVALSMRQTIRDAYMRADAASPLARQARERYEAVSRTVEEEWAAYVDTVITVAENFDAETLRDQHAVLAVELESLDRGALAGLVGLFVEHAAAYRSQGRVDRPAWQAALAGQ